jgi:hypothetical protein
MLSLSVVTVWLKSCMDTIAEIWAACAGGLLNDELKTKLIETIDQYVGILFLSYII